MREEVFTASDLKPIICVLWNDVSNPKGVVQIVHGMKEHIRRYDRFARYLNSCGYIVYGDDHRAHGKTARHESLIGKPDGEKDLFAATASDVLAISDMLRKKYGLPLFLLGHSYGSFIAQMCLKRGGRYDGTCLCGSAKYPYIALAVARLITSICRSAKSDEANADVIEYFALSNNCTDLKQFWTTRDVEQVKKYLADPYTNKRFSYGFYHSLLGNLMELHRGGIKNASVEMPLLIISGGCDAVGGNLKFIKPLYKFYSKFMKNISVKIYGGARHELLQELNYLEVQSDINSFFNYCLEK